MSLGDGRTVPGTPVLLSPGAGQLCRPGLFACCPEQGAEAGREGTVPVNHKVEQCGPAQMAGRLRQPQLARNELPGPINHSRS